MILTHFVSAADFRAWLEEHHTVALELVVGFHNKSSGRGGLTYAEAVDEALCFGWIDGLVRRIDADTHSRRFTPRKPGSIWSNVNVRHVARLTAARRMRAAGLAAFARRDAAKTGVYSFENRPKNFSATLEKLFRANRLAWGFWQRQPPGYRRTVIWWVVRAKRDDTRQRRFARLLATSARGRRLE